MKMKMMIAAALTVAGLAACPVLAANPSIDLINSSSDVVDKVQMSNIDSDTWHHDLLGASVLPIGYEIPDLMPTDAPTGYCRYDIRVTFDSGRELILHDFNACTTASIVLHDRSFDIADTNGDVTNRRGDMSAL